MRNGSMLWVLRGGRGGEGRWTQAGEAGENFWEALLLEGGAVAPASP